MTLLHLPLLEPHKAALETCVYCPKLSRAACPVSNAEASETTTPWGKMSLAYFAARGDIPVDAAHADPTWACTGCYGCRERCDHKNDVAAALTDARAEMFDRGAAPDAARRVAAHRGDFTAEVARAVDAAAAGHEDPNAGVVVLVGCGYARRAPDVLRDALDATSKLVGEPVRAARRCCGLPFLHAGDRVGFVAAATALAEELGGARRVVAVDPGCARAISVEAPPRGVPMPLAELFVDLAARQLDRLKPPADAKPVRYHDPCQLGRGLGRYDGPRDILRAATGQAPLEFQRAREMAECSGAGGLLPATRPATSRAIADARLGEHRAMGGGPLVTACASSLHRFRTRGEQAEDLVTVIARALDR